MTISPLGHEAPLSPPPLPSLDSERPPIVDCDFHNEIDSVKDLYPYMSRRWSKHIETFGLRHPNSGYYPRFMDNREEARPPSGRRAGSEVGFAREDYLEPFHVLYAVMNPLTPVSSTLDLDLGAAMATAVNDWQIAEWLDPEPRMRASVVITPQDPVAAAAEIRRCGSDGRFVQALFLGRMQEPMGRRRYWPIYEACVETGLQVASHAFSAYGHPITGAGHPSYYIEDHTSPPQAVQANITSMVVEGVFDRFPSLRLISVENGFAWLPALMWRVDAAWALLRDEVASRDRLPSEVIAEHVYVTTQPIEEPPRRQDFLALLDHFGELRSHILMASDYPHWDGDNPDVVLPAGLDEALVRGIRRDNAIDLYGL